MIPCSGTIKASDINTELSRVAAYGFKIGNPEERALAGKPSGLIKFSDFACKSAGFDLGIGYFSGFSEEYIGFMNTGGLERADTGNIKGEFPSPFFPINSIGNNTVGFYFHQIAYQSSSHGGDFYIMCNANSPQGYLTSPVTPWGSSPLVQLTDSSGNTFSILMELTSTGKAYQSVSPVISSIRDWLYPRRDTTVKVSISY